MNRTIAAAGAAALTFAIAGPAQAQTSPAPAWVFMKKP